MDIENRLVVSKRERFEGGMDWEFAISRRKLLHIEWINNKVQGNSIQYPVINHSGKEYETECIYMYN